VSQECISLTLVIFCSKHEMLKQEMPEKLTNEEPVRKKFTV
jgi:hypothetical protein